MIIFIKEKGECACELLPVSTEISAGMKSKVHNYNVGGGRCKIV